MLLLRSILSMILLVFALQQPAWAVLHLQLTQGVDETIPIALHVFANRQAKDEASAISSDIHHDLQLSGRFHVIAVHNQPQTTQAKSEYAIHGKVTKLGSGKFRVAFQCQDLFSDRHDSGHPVLIARSFVINSSQLSRVAHRISDLLYQAITDEPGIFSTRLAYVLMSKHAHGALQYRLKLADYDGRHAKTIMVSPEPILSPVWSPDAKRLAYVSFEHKRAGIYEQELATGKRRRLTALPGINGAPAYSPDGSKMVLVLSRQTKPKLYLMDLQTTQLTQLTHDNAIDTEPHWLADGSGLLFTSNRGGGVQIYRYDLKTKKITRVTYKGRYNVHANMDPKQEHIIYHHRVDGHDEVAMQHLKTGRLRLLTKIGSIESPSLSPNGRMVVFARRDHGRSVLGMVSIDGRIHLMLPADEGGVREPSWSPYLQRG